MASHAAFKPKKVLYFTVGAALNAQEKTQLAYLNASTSPVYTVAVRTIVGSLSYGGTSAQSHHDIAQTEPGDFIAYSDAALAAINASAVLTAYIAALTGAGATVLAIPSGSGALAMVVSPAAQSFNHTGGSVQMVAIVKKQDGSIVDVTTDPNTVWSMTSGANIHVGAATGIVTATAAGTDTVKATYTPPSSSAISASQGITAT